MFSIRNLRRVFTPRDIAQSYPPFLAAMFSSLLAVSLFTPDAAAFGLPEVSGIAMISVLLSLVLNDRLFFDGEGDPLLVGTAFGLPFSFFILQIRYAGKIDSPDLSSGAERVVFLFFAVAVAIRLFRSRAPQSE